MRFVLRKRHKAVLPNLHKNFNFCPTKTKKGFGFVALANLYDYGAGSQFPKNYHSHNMKRSTYTKRTSIARIRYNSEKLIPRLLSSSYNY